MFSPYVEMTKVINVKNKKSKKHKSNVRKKKATKVQEQEEKAQKLIPSSRKSSQHLPLINIKRTMEKIATTPATKSIESHHLFRHHRNEHPR